VTPPLSILLPVHNAQTTLAADVAKFLDVLPELTAWFDLLIIDDGSTDATCEIAEDLVTEYPQVRLIRHAMRRGIEGSWRIGLGRTDAPIVIAYNGRAPIDPAAILQLIRKPAAKNRAEENDARESRGGSQLIRWLTSRALADEPPTVGGFCILRRDAELPMIQSPNLRRIEPAHRIQNAPTPTKPNAAPRPANSKQSAPRPSFLARLQNLALGE
jgi:dolichol-phosphate mannosyltransferase